MQLTVLFFIIAILQVSVDCRRSSTTPRVSKSQRKTKRMEILCCGRRSCLDTILKRRQNSSGLGSSQSPNSSLLTSTFIVTMSSKKEKTEQAPLLNQESSHSKTPSTTNVRITTSSSSKTGDGVTTVSSDPISTTSVTTAIELDESMSITTTSSMIKSTSPVTSLISTFSSSTPTTDLSSTPTSLNSSISSSSSAPLTTTTDTLTTTTTKPVTTTSINLKPACPTQRVKEASFFKTDGSLEDPDAHGFWRTACGELFLFGKVLVNWEQNEAACAKLGMTPIKFENEDKVRCFEQFVDGTNWRFNSRYWTFAVRLEGSKFGWCQAGGAGIPPRLWGRDQPTYGNDTDNCAQMRVDARNSSVQLDDRHCGVLSALACQGQTTAAPACVAPVCPNITCNKNLTHYVYAYDGKTSYLQDPNLHGTWAVTEKSFLFSYENDTKTFTDAIQSCCGVGMKLISLHLSYKYDKIIDALNSSGTKPGQFWTSGTDLGCEDNFGYCSVNRLLRDEARWKRGQPDNSLGREHCLALDLDNATALLFDTDCDKPRRYICEGRVSGGVKAVEVECAMAYNLSSDVGKSVLLTGPNDIKEKCFLRCVGDAMDLFVNGKLVEERLISQFSSISGGDVNKLIDMYSTLNFCSNMTRGMDLCDKAAKLLDCGKENSPEAVAALMNNLEIAFTEAPLALPPVKGICPVDYKCLVDDDRKSSFDATGPGFFLPTMPDVVFAKVVGACGKRYLMLRSVPLIGMTEALELCCSFGLRMATFETKDEFDCLTQATPHVSTQSNSYIVAGSRMEYFSRPTWCFTGAPVDLSWAVDAITPNTDPSKFNLRITYDVQVEFSVWTNSFLDVICETV